MRPGGLSSAAIPALLLVSAGASAALLLQVPDARTDATAPWLLLALIGWAGAMWLVARTPEFDPRWVFGIGGLVLLFAVVRPLHYSGDVWSYAMYGRIVEHYRSNPYTRVPSAFRGDPIMHRVSRGWQSTPSYYGAGFTLISALVMRVAGTSATLVRVAYQSLAAVALMASAVMVHRRVPAVALVAVLLNPLLVVWVVNGGHTDTMIGCALGACALLLPRRPLLAAAAMAAALLIKVIVGLAFLGAFVWLWRRSRRDAWRFGVAVAVPVLAVNALFGFRAALTPLLHGAHQQSRVSPWEIVTHVHGVNLSPASLGPWPTVGFVVVTCAFVFNRAGARMPAPLVLGGVAGYLVAAAYILPWYAGWAFPLVALDWEAPLSKLLVAESVMLALTYTYRAVPQPGALDHVLLAVAVLTRVLLAVVAVAAVFSALRRTPRRAAHPQVVR